MPELRAYDRSTSTRIALREAQRLVARAGTPHLHGDRDLASRGARRPGGSGVRVGVAAAPGPGVARAGVPLARALRGPALRLRGDHAGGYMDPVARLRGSCAQLVARGPGDSVLAPHRARAAAGPGHCGKSSGSRDWSCTCSTIPSCSFRWSSRCSITCFQGSRSAARCGAAVRSALAPRPRSCFAIGSMRKLSPRACASPAGWCQSSAETWLHGNTHRCRLLATASSRPRITSSACSGVTASCAFPRMASRTFS